MISVSICKSPQSQFYDVKDKRSNWLTCYHRILACVRHLLYGGTWLRRTVCSDKPLDKSVISPLSGNYDQKTLPWNQIETQESGGLCLLLHGMNASRKQWETYSRQFPKNFPQAHLVIGNVYRAGNCSLEAAGNPFIEVVENYLAKFPGKPIVLIGTSNGARLASYIETQIKPQLLQNCKLTVFSIAGVHGGTTLMDLTHKICCAKVLRHHPEIKKELSFHSEKSIKLITSLQERQKVWALQDTKASHYFFATTEDEKVRPLGSSLPYLESTPFQNYRIVVGESHETIVDSVQSEIFEIIKRNRFLT